MTSVTPLAATGGTEVIQVTPATSPVGEGHYPTSSLPCVPRPPGGHHPHNAARVRRRRHRHLVDFATVVNAKLPLVHPGHHRAELPAAGGGVPQPANPGDRGRHRPRHGGLVRRTDRYLPMGLGACVRPRPGRAGRIVPAGGTFAILFGLSMDYEVFSSRISEEWVHGGDNRTRCEPARPTPAGHPRRGHDHDLRVPGVFVLGPRVVGEFGLGLAAAVVLDAFMLRTVLVPALMHLAGRANWWLPRWLDRLLPQCPSSPRSPRQPYLSQPLRSALPGAGQPVGRTFGPVMVSGLRRGRGHACSRTHGEKRDASLKPRALNAMSVMVRGWPGRGSASSRLACSRRRSRIQCADAVPSAWNSR